MFLPPALPSLFARQEKTPATSGTLPTDSVSFGLLLAGCVIVLTALSYMPALALGSILERWRFGT